MMKRRKWKPMTMNLTTSLKSLKRAPHKKSWPSVGLPTKKPVPLQV